VRLVARGRRPSLKREICPRIGSGREVGPGYNIVLAEFVREHWSPERAAEASDSLRRARTCLVALRERYRAFLGGGPPELRPRP
jgi:hypothetical protein